jgi:hypothetical protein
MISTLRLASAFEPPARLHPVQMAANVRLDEEAWYDGRPVAASFVPRPARGHFVAINFEKPGAARRARMLCGIFSAIGLRSSLSLARARLTGRGGSSRRLLRRRWRRSRSHAWFTATVHHAHFSSAALADRGTHLGVRYADAIDQLTAKTTSLANGNDRVVRLLKWGVRHTLR